MKATGIVRRIDDLGRVVIPKEIRRTFRIREGDPLEIYTTNEGEIIFKKYSQIGDIASTASKYCETMHRLCSMPIVITDRDRIVACGGLSKKEFMESAITQEVQDIIESRNIYCCDSEGIKIAENGSTFRSSCIVPIICEGDAVGCVALMCEEFKTADESDVKIIKIISNLLSRQLEN